MGFRGLHCSRKEQAMQVPNVFATIWKTPPREERVQLPGGQAFRGQSHGAETLAPGHGGLGASAMNRESVLV